MQIDRPSADVASARKRHFRPLIFAEQCADQIIRCTYFSDKFIVNIKIPDKRSIDPYRVSIQPLYPRSNLLDGIE